jgi:hypothetical protein
MTAQPHTEMQIDETDRVRPAFERDQFGNPPQFPDNIDVDWRR